MMAQTTADIASSQRQSQTTVNSRESFQSAGQPQLDHEHSPLHHQHLDGDEQRTSNDAIASQTFDSAILAGFRTSSREDATIAAEKTLAAGALATETILQMAGYIQDMKSRLKRKEFSAFVKELLQWVGEEARKYLDIARTFKDFDLSRLRKLEPFTLLKLRSKRYLPVVEKLRDVPVITPKIVQDLIDSVLPKQPKKKQESPISAWKRCRSGGGRYYQVQLHDEQTGLMIEQQAQESGILPQKVIAEAVALRAKYKSDELEAPGSFLDKTGHPLPTQAICSAQPTTQRGCPVLSGDNVTQVTELVANPSSLTDSVLEQAQPRTEEVQELAPTDSASVSNQQFPLDDEIAFPESSEPVDEVTIAQREVSQYLEEQAAAIAILPEGAVLAGEDESEIQWLLNAPIHSVEEVIRSIPVRSAYRTLYLLNQFQSGDTKRMELLEQRVTEHHVAIGAVQPGQVIALECTEDSSQTPEATGSEEAEQESSYLEPTTDDEYSVELEEDAQELEPEPQVIQEGDKDSSQHQQDESASQRQIAAMWKARASELGLVLDYTTIGEYTVRHNYRKLGTVVQKWGSDNNSWWENRQQVSSLWVGDGDGTQYDTPESAAIALAKLMRVIDEGSSASADLFGGGWESEPSHLVEEHADFIDDVDQEVLSLQPVGAVSSCKAQSATDRLEGFDF